MSRSSPGSTDRFLTSLPLGECDCIIWPFAKDSAGYGKVRREYAHRMAFQLAFGAIPDGMLVMHTCDNPSCVNPAHLLAGTQKENMADRRNKGRHPKGVKSGTARLSDEMVREARRQHKNGCSSVRLAHAFGVSQSAMWYALSGKTWSHVDD